MFKLSESVKTTNWHPFSIRFHPFNPDIIACAASSDFGLKGPGQLQIHDCRKPICIDKLNFADGAFDVCWSEKSPNICAIGCANGEVVLVNIMIAEAAKANSSSKTMCKWKEHQREVSGVDWNLVSKDCFISCSWDGSVKLWDPGNTGRSIATYRGHSGLVYQAVWSPMDSCVFCSVSSDKSAFIWDTRTMNPVQKLNKAHRNDIISTDWNKFDGAQIATGSADNSVKIWDLRKSKTQLEPCALAVLGGHFRAVKRVKFSPFLENIIGSCGYDMTVKIWNMHSLNPLVMSDGRSTEFVTCLDFSLHDSKKLAFCSWDETIYFSEMNEI